MDREEFHTVLLRSMVMMMLADGKVVFPEVELISRLHRDLTGGDLGSEDLDRLAREIREESRSPEEYLAEATEGWKRADRRLLLRSACMVSVADRELVRDERILLIRFGRAMGLRAQEVRAVHEELIGD
jgi:hypothetical protein